MVGMEECAARRHFKHLFRSRGKTRRFALTFVFVTLEVRGLLNFLWHGAIFVTVGWVAGGT